jgi:pimeloyl-ACP methyl ester carboxylesterase
MKRGILSPLLLAPLAYALMRAEAVARVRRYETVDADTADLPGVRLYIRGRRLHLTIDGQGPPLLMLHGFGSSGAAFRRLAPHLRSSMTVIAPDLPGWGYSERSPGADHTHGAQAALMLELLDRLGIARIMVLGHGTAAAIAIHMAQAAPDWITALVLADYRGRDPSLPIWLRPLLVLVVPLLVETGWGQQLLMRAVKVRDFRPDQVLLATHLNEARVLGHAATFLAILTSTRRTLSPDLRAVHVPRLSISVVNSPYGTAAAIVDFVRQFNMPSATHPSGEPQPFSDQVGAIRP